MAYQVGSSYHKRKRAYPHGSSSGLLTRLFAGANTVEENPKFTQASAENQLGYFSSPESQQALTQPLIDRRNLFNRLAGDPNLAEQYNAQLTYNRAAMPLEQQMAQFRTDEAIRQADTIAKNALARLPEENRLRLIQQAGSYYAGKGIETPTPEMIQARAAGLLAEELATTKAAQQAAEKSVTDTLIERLTRGARVGTAESTANIARQRGIYGEEFANAPENKALFQNANAASLIAPVSDIAAQNRINVGPGGYARQLGNMRLGIQPFEMQGSRLVNEPIISNVEGVPIKTGETQKMIPAEFNEIDPITGLPYTIQRKEPYGPPPPPPGYVAPPTKPAGPLKPPVVERQADYSNPAAATQQGLAALLEWLRKQASKLPASSFQSGQ